MKMPKREDMEALERQVRPWLKKMGIPQQKYRKLESYDKVLLYDLVCARTHRPSDKELRDLYAKLRLSETREGYPSDAVNSMTNEGLKEFFSQLTPSETLHYLEKF